MLSVRSSFRSQESCVYIVILIYTNIGCSYVRLCDQDRSLWKLYTCVGLLFGDWQITGRCSG